MYKKQCSKVGTLFCQTLFKGRDICHQNTEILTRLIWQDGLEEDNNQVKFFSKVLGLWFLIPCYIIAKSSSQTPRKENLTYGLSR